MDWKCFQNGSVWKTEDVSKTQNTRMSFKKILLRYKNWIKIKTKIKIEIEIKINIKIESKIKVKTKIKTKLIIKIKFKIVWKPMQLFKY